MNTKPTSKLSRLGLAVFAAGLLVTGAAWRGIEADSHTSAAMATVTSPITHSIAGGRDSYADVVDVVAPAVVTIRTEGKARASETGFEEQGQGQGQDPDDLLRRFFGDQFGMRGRGQRGERGTRAPKQHALGSGVIVSKDGYILTNNHVVDGADDIKVDLTDDRTVTAKIIGTDKASDLALIKVGAGDLHPIAIGDSNAVKVGDVVLAVGNPLGVGQTVTMGIISAKGRSTGVGDGSYEDFLQTDAPINHGNSGGALVNTKGELVGINSQILSSNDGNIGIGFAIPANMARHVMDELRTNGKVTRAQLGVTVQGITPEMADSLGLKQTTGAIVSSVSEGGAAERAGVKRGDVIEAFNGQPVHDMNSLRNRVAEAGPGSTAELTVLRDGASKHLSVKLDEANSAKSARANSDSGSDSQDSKTSLGVSVAPLTPELRSQLRAGKDVKGLVVEDVSPDGRAANAGIQQGDIIQEVNRQAVSSVDDLKAALKKSASDRPTLMLINRQGSDIFVTVRPANG